MMEKVPPNSILRRTLKALKPLEKMSFLEQYAIFMGKAQITETGLKKILIRRYKYNQERIEKWTLGKTIRELEDCKFEPNFILILKEFLDYRNAIAHNLLSDDALMIGLVGPKYRRISQKSLDRGLFCVEQVIQIYDALTPKIFSEKHPRPTRKARR